MICRYCDRRSEVKFPLYSRAFHGDMLYFFWYSGFDPSLVVCDYDFGLVWSSRPAFCPFCGRSIKRS